MGQDLFTHDLVINAANADASLDDRHDAFGELVRSFQDMAVGCAYAVLGDFEMARDAAQESFLAAWRNLHQLRDPHAFPGWFKRIVLSECSRQVRRARPWLLSMEDACTLASADENLQIRAERRELRDVVHTAIGRLPMNERVAVTLFYIGEYSHHEISRFLNLPKTTIAKRLYMGRQHLSESHLSALRKEFTNRRPSKNARFVEDVRNGMFDGYVGRYQFETRPELVVTIRRDGDRLIGEAGGQVNILFTSGRSRNHLRTSEFDGRGRFVRNAQGIVSHLIYYEFGRKMGMAKKIA